MLVSDTLFTTAEYKNDIGGRCLIIGVSLLLFEDVKKHDRMVALVETMLGLNKKLPEAKTDHETNMLKRQIDKLVYGLYDLTDDEIKIVEGE